MTRSDSVHVFDGSAGHVIAIISNSDDVGLFFDRPPSRDL